MNVRLSKCQSMPADAHWDLEHHRFHCTNKCSRTWQGSCRLCKGRKTCQGWFSYRLGEHWGEEWWGRLAKHWVLGETETQSISLQPRSPVSPSRCSGLLDSCSQRKKCPNPTASCQNVLTPTQAHPASSALCLASTGISSAPERDGKIQSKDLENYFLHQESHLLRLNDLWAQVSHQSNMSQWNSWSSLLPLYPPAFSVQSFTLLLPVHTSPCPLHTVWLLALRIPGSNVAPEPLLARGASLSAWAGATRGAQPWLSWMFLASQHVFLWAEDRA